MLLKLYPASTNHMLCNVQGSPKLQLTLLFSIHGSPKTNFIFKNNFYVFFPVNRQIKDNPLRFTFSTFRFRKQFLYWRVFQKSTVVGLGKWSHGGHVFLMKNAFQLWKQPHRKFLPGKISLEYTIVLCTEPSVKWCSIDVKCDWEPGRLLEQYLPKPKTLSSGYITLEIKTGPTLPKAEQLAIDIWPCMPIQFQSLPSFEQHPVLRVWGRNKLSSPLKVLLAGRTIK